MTIQQATGRTITKVETGDYDMMDEVGFVIAVRVLTTWLTLTYTPNLATATEGNPEEEVSKRQAGAGRAPRKCTSILNMFTTHDNTILYSSSP